MPNLTALVGLLVGLVALFVDPALAVKLISVYLILVGILRLISPENAVALPRAPRRASVAPTSDDEPEDADERTSLNPADAYRTFTPEELAPARRTASRARRRSAADESTEEEDEE